MPAKNKDKIVFQETLKGNKMARDRFGTPILEGEIVAYAIAQNSSAKLKVAKIIRVNRKDVVKSESRMKPDGTWEYVSVPDQQVTLTVQGANKIGNKWELQAKTSKLENIHNTIVLTNPIPEVVELFKDVSGKD